MSELSNECLLSFAVKQRRGISDQTFSVVLELLFERGFQFVPK